MFLGAIFPNNLNLGAKMGDPARLHVSKESAGK